MGPQIFDEVSVAFSYVFGPFSHSLSALPNRHLHTGVNISSNVDSTMCDGGGNSDLLLVRADGVAPPPLSKHNHCSYRGREPRFT